MKKTMIVAAVAAVAAMAMGTAFSATANNTKAKAATANKAKVAENDKVKELKKRSDAQAAANYIDRMRKRASDPLVRAEDIYLLLPLRMRSRHSDLAELDEILEQKPPLMVLTDDLVASKLPRTYAAALKYYAATKPNLVAKNERGKASLSNRELAAVYIESFNIYGAGNMVNEFRAGLGRRLSPFIVPMLRAKGVAVVAKKGEVDQVKAYAESVSAAINAPGFDGLNAVLSELGVPASIDRESLHLYSEEEAEDIAEEILSGNRDANTLLLEKLNASLGVEKYNIFVRRYNEGGR